MYQKLQTTLLLWAGLGLCLLGPGAAQAQARLIISQYYEGASNDKWIEIANTGDAVYDPAAAPRYLCLLSNPAAAADLDAKPTTFALLPSLEAGAVIVFRHESAILPAYALQQSTRNGVCNFNGNDIVFLSAANAQGSAWTARTDVVGNIGEFGKDKSLLRKGNLPATTWDPTDWETASNAAVDGAAEGSDRYLGCFRNRCSQSPPLIAGGTNTFDIVSWNLEWFGSPEKSGHATSFAQQLEAVSSKLLELNADVYALQEVTQTPTGNYLQQLVDKLNALTAPGTFSGVYGSRHSYYWEAYDPTFPPQKVAYIYRNATVTVKGQRSFFSQSYTGANSAYPAGYPGGKPSSFWASGRLPFELTIDASIQGTTQRLHLVNLHAKAMSDSKERRAFDGAVLFDSLRTAQYATKNIIVLGDFNDYLTGSTGGGTSPYAGWMTGGNAYFKAAATQDRSIDHVLISNELYNEFETGGKLSAIGSADISDHDPLLVSLLLSNDQEETVTGLEDLKAAGVKIFPNPTQTQATLQWDTALGEHAQVRVLDASGRLRWKGRLQQGESLQTESWAPGLYLLQLQWGKRSVTARLVVQ